MIVENTEKRMTLRQGRRRSGPRRPRRTKSVALPTLALLGLTIAGAMAWQGKMTDADLKSMVQKEAVD